LSPFPPRVQPCPELELGARVFHCHGIAIVIVIHQGGLGSARLPSLPLRKEARHANIYSKQGIKIYIKTTKRATTTNDGLGSRW